MPNIIEITDFSAPELDVYARMSEVELLNREFPDKGLFIAESPLVIGRALDAGYEPVSLLVEDKHIQTEASDVIARIGNVPVFTSAFDVLTNLTGFKLTRGMLCAMRRKAPKSPDLLCASAQRIAILENVMNPTNIGAIFRSAAALGIDALLLTPACCDPLYRRSVRVSMGTVFQIPWTWLPGEGGYSGVNVDLIHSFGFKTAAMALCDDAISIDDPNLLKEEKLAVILGSEGPGLCKATIENSTYRVIIPMSHAVDSLNVAAASAVAFWQLTR